MSPTTMRLTREEATFVIDYSKYLNDRARVIKPSGIRRFFDIANEMEDVISLSIGEPDFFTPWHIREEGITTLELMSPCVCSLPSAACTAASTAATSPVTLSLIHI